MNGGFYNGMHQAFIYNPCIYNLHCLTQTRLNVFRTRVREKPRKKRQERRKEKKRSDNNKVRTPKQETHENEIKSCSKMGKRER